MAKKRILIVDDEHDILTVLEKRLSLAGYEVLKADNGKDAITIAKHEDPDLIVLDIMMPEIDGTKVAEILKEDDKAKNIPVIFLTCLLTRAEEARFGNKIDGHLFVAKPFDPQDVLNQIKKLLPE